jgi:hypothetical protein
MIPLAVSAQGGMTLSSRLKQTAWRGVCVIAAHQYLRAQKEQGYIDKDGKPLINFKKEFEATGKLVTEYFLNKAKYETGNF